MTSDLPPGTFALERLGITVKMHVLRRFSTDVHRFMRSYPRCEMMMDPEADQAALSLLDKTTQAEVMTTLLEAQALIAACLTQTFREFVDFEYVGESSDDRPG